MRNCSCGTRPHRHCRRRNENKSTWKIYVTHSKPRCRPSLRETTIVPLLSTEHTHNQQLWQNVSLSADSVTTRKLITAKICALYSDSNLQLAAARGCALRENANQLCHERTILSELRNAIRYHTRLTALKIELPRGSSDRLAVRSVTLRTVKHV